MAGLEQGRPDGTGLCIPEQPSPEQASSNMNFCFSVAFCAVFLLEKEEEEPPVAALNWAMKNRPSTEPLELDFSSIFSGF